MFEIEPFICIKMDLALNNLQWLVCHKTQPNQTKLTVLCDRKIVYDYIGLPIFTLILHISYIIYIYIYIYIYQKFSKILVKWDKIQRILLRLWGRQTTLDSETRNSPDHLQMLLARFASMDWSKALQSTLLGKTDLVRYLRFLKPEQDF